MSIYNPALKYKNTNCQTIETGSQKM